MARRPASLLPHHRLPGCPAPAPRPCPALPFFSYRTLHIVRAIGRPVTSRSRTASAFAGGGGAAAAAAATAQAGASSGGVGGANDASSDAGGSACTADEDAFDVVEAFDDGGCGPGSGMQAAACPVMCPES